MFGDVGRRGLESLLNDGQRRRKRRNDEKEEACVDGGEGFVEKTF